MQKTFARALIKSGKFDVVHDRSSAERSTAGFFVEVKVTDFLHSSDAPESVRRLSWFTEANDAIVALDVTASNIHTSKIVFCDQVVATVLAGDKDTDQYGDLEFGSYLFWSTPLGKATTEAINDTVTKLATLRGSTPGTVTITKYVEGEREVTLSDRDILDDGGIYYVGTSDPVSHEFVSVDDDLGRPLRVKVEHHFFGNSTGWLLSEPAEYENIFGATLSKSPLPTQITSE
jgi:hypothetical protein